MDLLIILFQKQDEYIKTTQYTPESVTKRNGKTLTTETTLRKSRCFRATRARIQYQWVESGEIIGWLLYDNDLPCFDLIICCWQGNNAGTEAQSFDVADTYSIIL